MLLRRGTSALPLDKAAKASFVAAIISTIGNACRTSSFDRINIDKYLAFILLRLAKSAVAGYFLTSRTMGLHLVQ